jgi:hypothetical protein
MAKASNQHMVVISSACQRLGILCISSPSQTAQITDARLGDLVWGPPRTMSRSD